MISLSRDRTAGAIDPQFRGEKLLGASLGLLRAQREFHRGHRQGHDWKSHLWKKAKDQLLAETFDKCAYCEAPTAVVSYGDVEHYRPKSVYWWLAYCLENYLVSCAICNQRFKKNEFPVRDEGARLKPPPMGPESSDEEMDTLSQGLVPDPLDQGAVRSYSQAHLAEGSLLLNPYFDSPERFFAWRADLNLREVEMVSMPGDAESEVLVETANALYGLNRPQLLTYRFFFFDSYLTHKETLKDPGISAPTRKLNQQVIVNMTGPERPFAGMIRFFESVGSPPDWEAGGFLIR